MPALPGHDYPLRDCSHVKSLRYVNNAILCIRSVKAAGPFTVRPPKVGPNWPLYKFKGRRQRDTPTVSCFWAAQDIGFVRERYPDVAQILGLVKLCLPPIPSRL